MAFISHAGLSLISMVLLGGSLVMTWFVILSGLNDATPLDKTYFLRADTSGITGARPVTQWTYFWVCGQDNAECGPARAAMALGMAWDGGAANVPAALVGSYGGDTTSRYFWYMWRFGWVFYLIALFFATVAFFAGFLACCGRLGSALSGLVSLAALVFYSVAVSLMTATFVKMRDEFRAANRSASLGSYAFGFSWAAWALLLLSTVLYLLGTRGRKTDHVEKPSRWRRTRSTRSALSETGGRRVKEEYP